MKIAAQKNGNNFTKKNHHLPLVGEAKAHSKSNSCSFELLSDPQDANSQRFKITILRLSGGEDVRTVLQWRRDLAKVLGGLNLTTAHAKVKIITTIMSGTPQTTFETKVQAMATAALNTAVAAIQPNPQNANAQGQQQQALVAAGIWPHLTDLMVTHSLAHAVQEMMPKKVLARVKREVRRDMRKPADMTIRDYFNHLQRINLLEVQQLPPFGADQVFKNDEIIDIMVYGIPKSWQREMDRQGFDPYSTTDPVDTVNFLEQIEAAEEFDSPNKVANGNSNGIAKKKSSSSSNTKKSGNDASSSSKKVYCDEHGWNYTHATAECKVLNGGGKKQKSGDYKKKSYGNKTWNRKADDATSSSKKDLAAFIKKSVAKGVRQEMNKIDKKRNKSDSSIEDDNEFDLNAFDKDIPGFNYKEMDKMKLESDDSDSVSV